MHTRTHAKHSYVVVHGMRRTLGWCILERMAAYRRYIMRHDISLAVITLEERVFSRSYVIGS